MKSDEVHNKETEDLLKLFSDLSSQPDSRFNRGMQKLVTQEIQSKLATNFLGVVNEETRFREKMENDILKDVQVILGHQADKMEEIAKILEAEEAYLTFDYLRENAKQQNVSAIQLPDLPYINDKESLMKAIMVNGGAPDE